MKICSLLVVVLHVMYLCGAALSDQDIQQPLSFQLTRWVTLPNSIVIPGDKGKATEVVDLDSIDDITKKSFKDSIQEQDRYNLPWIMAALWWKKDNGTLARDYADAVNLNAWRLDDQFNVKNKLHPLYHRKIISSEYYAFEVSNNELSVEYLGGEEEFHEGTLLQDIFYAVAHPTEFGVDYFKQPDVSGMTYWNASYINWIALGYKKKGDLVNTQKWWRRGLNKGDLFSMYPLMYWYIEAQDYDNALEVYDKARGTLDIEKKDVHRFENLMGYMYELKGDIPLATDYYIKALGQEDPSKDAPFNLLYLYATYVAIEPKYWKHIDLNHLTSVAKALLQNTEYHKKYKSAYPERFETAINLAKFLSLADAIEY